jgi:hypothetical protein
MTLKQILRRAPEEAELLVYSKGMCRFYTNGTHMMEDFINKEYPYKTKYKESRFIAHKENGKWEADTMFTERQIADILRSAESYTEKYGVSPNETVRLILKTLKS